MHCSSLSLTHAHTRTHTHTNKNKQKNTSAGSKGLFTRSAVGYAFSQEKAARGFWVMRYVSVSQSLPCDWDGFLLSGDESKSLRDTEVERDNKCIGCSLCFFPFFPSFFFHSPFFLRVLPQNFQIQFQLLVVYRVHFVMKCLNSH